MSNKIIVLSSRPAKVKDEIKLNLSGETPLKKRDDSSFRGYFDLIWRELTNEEENK